MRLLYVEDQLESAAIVKEELSEFGFAVDHATTIEDADYIEGLAEYDAVILDRHLPDGDGLQWLQSIRKRGCDTPTIILTAFCSGPVDVASALNHGADDFLTKPFMMEELSARLRAILRRRSATDETLTHICLPTEQNSEGFFEPFSSKGMVFMRIFIMVFLLIAGCFGPGILIAKADTVQLETGQGERIDIPRAASSLFVSNPAVADIQLASPKILFIFAKDTGETSVLALDDAGETIWESRVKVSIPLSDLNRLLKEQIGDYGILAEEAHSGVVLTGMVPTPELSNKAMRLAEGYLGGKSNLINFIKVSGLQQVNLRVQVAEVSRSLTDELGIDWDAAIQVGEFIAQGATNVAASLAGAPGGSITLGFDNSKGDSILSVIRALSADGLISILAEPNLTAQSGQKAKFLAGGEFPVPVGQGNSAVSVEFRDFGVGLEFLPTVLSEDKIQLEVSTEVSELSTQGAISAAGQNVFAVTTRRAETGVTLASGQTFAIAGLIQNTYQSTINRVPGLSDAPVIGPLFRSNSFRKNDTELIIIVTPYIVNPAQKPSALVLPEVTEGRSSHLELLLFGQKGTDEVYGPKARHSLAGNPGFLLE